MREHDDMILKLQHDNCKDFCELQVQLQQWSMLLWPPPCADIY